MKAADFTNELSMASSETRAGVLVACCQRASVPTARVLLRDWFSICDALAPWRDALREQFQRVGWVTDSKQYPAMPVMVWRGAWHDDEAADALSWTTSREKAEWFARYLNSPRAWFLGIRRDDAVASVFQAYCLEAFAYFNGREEQEIVPKRLLAVQRVAELRPVEEGA